MRKKKTSKKEKPKGLLFDYIKLHNGYNHQLERLELPVFLPVTESPLFPTPYVHRTDIFLRCIMCNTYEY